MPKVLFVQRMIPDYRLPFFVRLHEKLKEAGVDLYVTTGESLADDYLNDTAEDYSWIIKHRNYYFYKTIHIHNIKSIHNYNMVIVMQENSHLINFYLLIRRYMTGRPLMAFYGHGRNLNTKRNRVREYLKKKISLLPDWWFAYTALTERVLLSNGYPEQRITIANNAIDDSELKRIHSELSEGGRLKLRGELGIGLGAKVALYCGRLINIKVSFLISSLELIREKNNTFEALIIGTGPLEDEVHQSSKKYEWLHYLGPIYGNDRVKYFCVSDVFLMPGVVGLAILDAFATGLPIITTDCKVHGPEIEYLEQGVNGFITSDNVKQYSDKVCELLGDEQMLIGMKTNATRISEKYSVDKMADNFSAGIQRALKSVRLGF